MSDDPGSASTYPDKIPHPASTDPDKITTPNNNKRGGSKRLLVRQQATTEQDFDAVVIVSDDKVDTIEQCDNKIETIVKCEPVQEHESSQDLASRDRSRSPNRIIYRETIDISPSSPGSYRSTRALFEAKRNLNNSNDFGSARYLAKQHSQNGYNRTFGSSELTKQQSLTTSSPTARVSGSGGHIIKQHSLSPATSRYLYKQQSMSRNSCYQVSKSPSPAPSSKNSYGSARFLPKQYSCTSNSSAYLSPQNNSSSLVDIPTYLCYPVQLATVTYEHKSSSSPVPASGSSQIPSNHPVRVVAMKPIKKPPTKTKWTLFCIAVGFLTVCIVLVGTMLSYTSEYQDREVARNMFYNVNNTTLSYPSHTDSTSEKSVDVIRFA